MSDPRWCWQKGRYGYWEPGNGEIAWVQHVAVFGANKEIEDQANRAIEQAHDTLTRARQLAAYHAQISPRFPEGRQRRSDLLAQLLDLLTGEGQ